MDIFSLCYKRERLAVVHLTSNQSLLQASCIIYNLKYTVFGVRPKLKFYLFPLIRATLKKDPTQKFYFNFQSRIFFLISLQPM